ncbi:MAG: GerMN domain-containing protein [Candidatus Paceibacterota bacterium]
MNKKILFLLLIVIALGFFIFIKNKEVKVNNFEECVRESGIVMESYPRQCKSFDGKIYIEKIKEIDKNTTIIVDGISEGMSVDSPLILRGRAKGNWFFEGSFPVKLVDSENNSIASGVARATANSLTDEFVPFETRLEFNIPEKKDGMLVFKNDNPSGMPENDIYYRIPVVVNAGSETVKVKVFFANDNIDKEVTCNNVYYVEREVENTKAIATAAINELLKGTTEKEEADGYRTLINSGVKINKLVIENGIAKIDFSSEFEKGMGGSCKVSLIRKQIEETLKQFEAVKSVVISVNGDSESILQP